MDKFIINRALSVKYGNEKSLHIGINPPSAVIIEDPPEFLGELIKYFSTPRSLQDAIDHFAGFGSDLIERVIDDLLGLNVFVLSDAIGRYDRHQLYFSLLGIDRKKYHQILRNKTIGIVGAGGIGSTCAMLLTAAGIGAIVLTDGDVVEESNLTRSVLFSENDIGNIKVNSAKNLLLSRNSNTQIEVLPKFFLDENKEEFEKVLKKCDVIILSADSPEGHTLLNDICLFYKIPYVNIGYIETYAAIGPFVIPGLTSCYKCEELYLVDRNQEYIDGIELNPNLQAASYGPVNSLASSIAVNEVLRYLFELEISTASRRLLISSENYEISTQEYLPHPRCKCTSDISSKEADPGNPDNFKELADVYNHDRESESFNSLLLDDLLDGFVDNANHKSILDLGCGIGTNSIRLAKKGHHVTALDISKSMLDIFRSRIPKNIVENIDLIHGDACNVEFDRKFDCIFLTLIIDHIEDPLPLLQKCRELLADNGFAIITIPHPIKDAGVWKKSFNNGRWEYSSFEVNDYFGEGKMSKSRENDKGEEVVASITSYRRTISTYYDLIVKAGISISRLIEPSPSGIDDEESINQHKSSIVPYFMLFVCGK